MGIGFESKKKSSKSTVAVCLNLMIDIGETATAVVVSCLFGVNLSQPGTTPFQPCVKRQKDLYSSFSYSITPPMPNM